jgi:hypothetical protein
MYHFRGTCILGIVLAASAMVSAGCAENAARADAPVAFDEITVKRINVVGEDGKLRMILSNEDRSPNPVIDGKELPRAHHQRSAGILYFRQNGSNVECGGAGTAKVDEATNSGVILDYGKNDGIGIGKEESDDGQSYSAKLFIADRLPPNVGIDALKAGVATGRYEANDRIVVANTNGNATVTLSDPKGKPRIVLGVDAAGEASFKILDKDGRVVFTAPQ